jgi:hypothetical protein
MSSETERNKKAEKAERTEKKRKRKENKAEKKADKKRKKDKKSDKAKSEKKREKKIEKKSNDERSSTTGDERVRRRERRAPLVAQAQHEDRHDLYQRAVQDCAADMDFLLRAHREVYGEQIRPTRFREDFCGTAAMCAEWIRRGTDHLAEGFDIDAECLQWGRAHNLAPLGAGAERIVLHQRDVREEGDAPADIRCAHNFSYQILQERAEMLDYFRRARAGLTASGIFVLDLYGGSESFVELVEEREIEDGAFTYVWEQRRFHPATGHTDCFIHFRFPDGSEMHEAFRYSWRLYTPPELRDLLHEAGFRDVRTYFEEFDEEGDGTGVFARDEEGPACEGWLGYMVAIP